MRTIDPEALRLQLIHSHEGKTGPAILAIDGRCAAGKTTLAGRLAGVWDAPLFSVCNT